MKPQRLLIWGVVAVVIAYLVRRLGSAPATGLDRAQAANLLGAIRTAYDATLAAFDPSGSDVSDFDERDARAAAAAEALQNTVRVVQPTLAQSVAPMVAEFVGSVGAAQVQIMAFAINRKNRGLPDAAQAAAEVDDRQAFRREAEPAFTRLVAALS